MECSKRGVSHWCNGKDVKVVQLKSVPTAYDRSKNVFKGDVVYMCQECRKSNTGQFKIVPGMFK